MKKVLTMVFLATLLLVACEKEEATKIFHEPSFFYFCTR